MLHKIYANETVIAYDISTTNSAQDCDVLKGKVFQSFRKWLKRNKFYQQDGAHHYSCVARTLLKNNLINTDGSEEDDQMNDHLDHRS